MAQPCACSCRDAAMRKVATVLRTFVDILPTRPRLSSRRGSSKNSCVITRCVPGAQKSLICLSLLGFYLISSVFLATCVSLQAQLFGQPVLKVDSIVRPQTRQINRFQPVGCRFFAGKKARIRHGASAGAPSFHSFEAEYVGGNCFRNAKGINKSANYCSHIAEKVEAKWFIASIIKHVYRDCASADWGYDACRQELVRWQVWFFW